MTTPKIVRGVMTIAFLFAAPLLATEGGLDGLLATSISMWAWLLMPVTTEN